MCLKACLHSQAVRHLESCLTNLWLLSLLVDILCTWHYDGSNRFERAMHLLWYVSFWYSACSGDLCRGCWQRGVEHVPTSQHAAESESLELNPGMSGPEAPGQGLRGQSGVCSRGGLRSSVSKSTFEMNVCFASLRFTQARSWGPYYLKIQDCLSPLESIKACAAIIRHCRVFMYTSVFFRLFGSGGC